VGFICQIKEQFVQKEYALVDLAKEWKQHGNNGLDWPHTRISLSDYYAYAFEAE